MQSFSGQWRHILILTRKTCSSLWLVQMCLIHSVCNLILFCLIRYFIKVYQNVGKSMVLLTCTLFKHVFFITFLGYFNNAKLCCMTTVLIVAVKAFHSLTFFLAGTFQHGSVVWHTQLISRHVGWPTSLWGCVTLLYTKARNSVLALSVLIVVPRTHYFMFKILPVK